jgi:hydroxymethylpyrimidine pyrophosphatase-like HAD family hydrolase
MAGKRKISLVLADVDGTLVTEEKLLTKRAHDAVNALHDAGISFAITSGRPPLGMAMLFDVLDIETPIAGFNGGFLSSATSVSWSKKRCQLISPSKRSI